MGIVYPGVPPALATLLQQRAAIDTFVETGTAYGKTAFWASRHFAQVYTIEGSPELYTQARAAYGHVVQITFLLGDSREHLRDLVGRLERPALFWLDAHWSGGVTYGEGDQCPLLEEIAAIDAGVVDHLLLIDDARLFLAPPPRPHHPEQWPTLVETIAALTRYRPGRTIMVLDDVLIAVPSVYNTALTAFAQDLATERWARSRRPSRGWLFARRDR